MRIRQTWFAVSSSKSTIMFSPAPSSIIVPPLSSAHTEVSVNLEAREMSDSNEFWIALSQEDGTSA